MSQYDESDKDGVRKIIAGGQWIEQPTLRDHFAMAALTGMIAQDMCDGGSPWVRDNNLHTHLAKWSYEVADAMLHARKQAEEERCATCGRIGMCTPTHCGPD